MTSIVGLSQQYGSDLFPQEGSISEEEYTTFQEAFFNFREVNGSTKSMSTYTIPTVVHVIHNNGPENISNAEIIAGLDNLNSKFNGEIAGADCDIEFRLAKIDPNGDCTSGITRTVYNKPNVTGNDSYPNYVSAQTIKDLNNWPQEKYLNIWIVRDVSAWRNIIPNPTPSAQFRNIGSIQYRRGIPQWTEARDGIIIQYSNFNGGTFNGMDGSSILTRAAGTYLNLINVWGDGPLIGGCCRPDEENYVSSITKDLINDTPPCNFYSDNNNILGFDELMTEISNCNSELNCNNPQVCDISNPNDFFPKDNYMSYNFNCMDKFTQGQAEWMWNGLDFYRSELINLENLYATGVLTDIQTSVEWNSDDFLNGDIYVAQSITIPQGAELHINSGVTVHFAGDAKLIIETGGKVVIDGARLTNYCEELWKGIEVQGNRDADQSPTSNQGYLFIKNGSIIENAECAVRMAKNNSTNGWSIAWLTSGGIIRATDTSFRNNVKDIEFLPYHNINDYNQNLYNNVSYFRDCEFIVNQTLNDDSDELNERVSLYAVEGVSFTRCHFAVEGFGLLTYAPNERGKGIRAFNAGFSVRGGCSVYYGVNSECEADDITAQSLDDPNSNFTPSTFENFEIGIKATSSLTGPPVSVFQTVFDNNEFSVQLVNMNSAVLRRNKFNIPKGQQWINYGAQLNGCTEYTIERNVFNSITTDPDAAQFGLNIINSGDQEHEAYLNDFDGLLAGIVVQQQNQNHNTENGGNDSDVGLELRCNDFSDTTYDIALTNNASIANLQGDYIQSPTDVTAPAGNVFEPNNDGNENDYFVGIDSEWFVYLHHDEGNQNIPYVKPESIDIQDVTNVRQEDVPYTIREDVCPINGSSILSATNNRVKVLEKRSIIEELKLDLDQTVDGGNTAGLISIINNPSYSDIEVRNTLQQISPYLSNAVLTACIERDQPLNVWVLCEIMLANSPLHFSVLEIYEEELPLPVQLDNLLWLYQSGSSSMNVMKSQIKSQVRSKERALNAYTENVAFAEDSEINEARKLILEGEETNRKIRSLVTLDIQEEKLGSAQALVDSYEPKTEKDNFKEYVTLFLSLDRSEGNSLITEGQISEIRDIASGDKTMRIAAAAFLEELTGEILYPQPVAPSESSRAPVRVAKERTLDKLVSVFPNPANSYFYVTYVLPIQFSSASLEVYDLKGSLVNRVDVSNGIGMEYMDSRNLSNGTYIALFLVDGQKVSEEKITVIR